MTEPSRPPFEVVQAGGDPAEDEAPRAADVRFFYDFATPASYLALERLVATLGGVPELVPVRRRDLEEPAPRRPADDDVSARSALAELVAARGLQPLRWPAGWPFDDELALRAATYARGIGKVAAFSFAALRQTYAGGADLSQEQTVLIAAAACEIHPRALLTGMDTKGTLAALDRAGAEAREAGVRDLPATVVRGEVHVGDEGLETAAAAIARGGP